MKNRGRILLLASAVVLLIGGVVCLKRRLGDEDAPPAFLKPSGGPTRTSPENRLTHQPTILSPDPSTDAGSGVQFPWRDTEGSPIGNADGVLSPTFPVNTLLPPANDPVLNEDRRPPTFDGRLEPAYGEGLDANPPAADPGSESQRARPTSLITKRNDSLWSIAERAYGQGVYYRALFAHNRERIARPDLIPEGVEVQLPPLEELRRLYPDLCPAMRAKSGS